MDTKKSEAMSATMNHAISEKESCDQALLQTAIETHVSGEGYKNTRTALTLRRVILGECMRSRWAPDAEARHYGLTRGKRDTLVDQIILQQAS